MGWNYEGQLPYSLCNGSSVVLNNEIHILGSMANSSNYTKHYKYSNGEWISVSTLPYNFYNGSAVVLNGEIHILGTGVSANQKSHYKYSNGQWVEVSELPYAFGAGRAVVLNNEIHILGSGVGDGANQKKHYKYSNGEWTSVSTLPYYFYRGAAVVLNGEIHILGTDSTSGTPTNHYKYSNGQWTSVSTLPYRFTSGASVVLNNEIHILGSFGDDRNRNHYKYSSGQWTSVSELPYLFYNGSSVVLNDEIHILGSEYTSCYLYHCILLTTKTPNKIIFGNDVVLDLTADTVDADHLPKGIIAHDAAGNRILGLLNIVDRTPSLTSYTSLNVNSVNRILTRTGYLYGARPCGRNLFSTAITPLRSATGWQDYALATDVYSADGASTGTLLDPHFGHFDGNGGIVVDRAISTAYLNGIAWRGVTSSGTAVYSGIALYKNGTLVKSIYGSSSDTSPSFRRFETSFAVGDVLTFKTRVSNTTQAYCRATIGITWAGT